MKVLNPQRIPSRFSKTFSLTTVMFVLFTSVMPLFGLAKKAEAFTPIEIIVDNLDAGYSEIGTWHDNGGCKAGYVHNAGDTPQTRWAAKTTTPGTPTATATWTFTIPVTGNYEVFAHWSEHTNRATDAPYTVMHNGGSTTVDLNQYGPACADSGFQTLGTYSFTQNTGYSVTLSNDANSYVMADAIKVVSTNVPGEAWVNDDWAGNSVGDNVANGRVFGYNAFADIQDAVDESTITTINVFAGSYSSFTVDHAVFIFGLTSGAVVDGGGSDAITVISDDVTISGLEITGGGYGINSQGSNCSFYDNNLYTNTLGNALESGSGNTWDNGTIGNWWDDYTGVDLDSDNIGDTQVPYTNGGVSDNYPQTTNYLTEPTITDPANGSYNKTVDKVEWLASEGTFPNFEYQYEVFSDENYSVHRWGPSGWLSDLFIPTPGTPEGIYFLRVKARDSENNESVWSNGIGNAYKVIVDKTAPIITLEQPTDNGLYSGEIQLRATCDGTSGDCDYINFWWRQEGQTYDPADKQYHYVHTNGTVFEWTLDTLAAELWGGGTYVMDDGIYHIYAAGKDLAGNWARSNEITITVDNTAPSGLVSVDEDFNPFVDGNGFDISTLFTDDNDLVDCEYTIDNGTTWIPASLDVSSGECFVNDVTAASGDDLIIKMRATDVVGNLGTANATTRTADGETPWFDPEPGPEEWFEGEDKSFEITGNDDIDIRSLCMKIDGTDYGCNDEGSGTSYTWSTDDFVDLSTFSNGPIRYVTYTLYDSVGNSTELPVVAYNVTDNAPSVTINATPPSNVTYPKSITLKAKITWSAAPLTNEITSYIWNCRNIDDGKKRNVLNTATITLNDVGTYNCSVSVKDADGNSDSDSGVFIINPIPQVPQDNSDSLVSGVSIGLITPVSAQDEQDDEEQEVEEEDEQSESEEDIMGAETCDVKSKASGYIFEDTNSNDQRDEGEEGVQGVQVEIYYEQEGQEIIVATTRTSEDGYWEVEICPGDYKVRIVKDDLPEKTEVSGDEVLGVTVGTDADTENVNFAVKRTGTVFKWTYCLIPLAIIAALSVLWYFVSKGRRDREYEI